MSTLQHIAAEQTPEEGALRPRSARWRFLRAVLANRGAAVGLAIVLVLVVAAVLAELIAPHDPMRMGAGPRLVGPNLAYPFGTDEFGRDILSRVIHGTRLTLQIGTIAVGISLTAGLLIGLLAGYAGGWPERIRMRSGQPPA